MRGLLGEGDSVPGTKDPVTGGKAADPGDPDDADGGGGAAGGNGGDEIRHRSSFQRVPLCGTGKHGDTMRDGIPIFFSSCGKENGHSWSKEKALRDELAVEAANSPKTWG